MSLSSELSMTGARLCQLENKNVMDDVYRY